MSAKEKFAKDAIETAVRIYEGGDLPPNLIRQIILRDTHKALDRILGTEDIKPGGHFKRFLDEEAQRSSYDNDAADDGNSIDGVVLLVNAVEGFFHRAGQALLENGVEPYDLMHFFLYNAHEVLTEQGEMRPGKAARDRVMQYILRVHHEDEQLEEELAEIKRKRRSGSSKSAA